MYVVKTQWRVCARALIVSASRHLTLTAAYLLIAACCLELSRGSIGAGSVSLLISANVNTDFAHREHLRNEIGVGG